MILLNELQKPDRDNFLISGDANHGACFFEELFLDIVSNWVSSHPTVFEQFLPHPKEDPLQGSLSCCKRGLLRRGMIGRAGPLLRALISRSTASLRRAR